MFVILAKNFADNSNVAPHLQNLGVYNWTDDDDLSEYKYIGGKGGRKWRR